MNEQFRKKGYATEALSKLIEISTRTTFYLSIDFMNRASIKVAKKLGFSCKAMRGKTMIFTKNNIKKERSP